MVEFIKVGRHFINVADLHAIEVEPNGDLLLTYGNTVQTLKGEEAQALLDWVQARDAASKPGPSPSRRQA